MQAVLRDALLAQRGGLIGWLPVCLGIGIGGYFALPREPDGWVWPALAVGMLACVLCARLVPVTLRALLLGLATVVVGPLLAKAESSWVAGPVLGFRYYGPIEGRLVEIDQSASEAVRLTLDSVRLDRMEPARTPVRVRVSLHGEQPDAPFLPGETLILTRHLSSPPGPAEPGGFDFRRFAWFNELGAIGYTQTPVLTLTAPTSDWHLAVFTARMRISTAIQAALPGDPGGFAAALAIGDRSGMSVASQQNLRDANLYHIVSISGLHMGMLTGFIFVILRVGLSLWPALALRVPVKKIAAVVALIVGAVYLALSGGDVATERSYIMVAVLLVAILLDRQALSLRGLAVAAIIVLVMHPHALTGPGFQMSFAATAALIVAFRALRGSHLRPPWVRAGVTLVISSLVAGLASAPFAALHFNQISHYGLIANLVTVPMIGAVVMPAMVAAAVLAPVGLAPAALWVAGLGLRWTLIVAETVAGWDGAVSHVKTPAPEVLPILALALLWVILWQGRARWGGLAGVVAALVLWVQSPRPTLLVADSGGLIGLLGPEGRSLSAPRGDGFTAGIWMENDGAPVDQELAAQRPGLIGAEGQTSAVMGGSRILQVRGKTALVGIADCNGADVLITNQPVAGQRPCAVYDPIRLRQTGALAFNLAADGTLVITTASDLAGQRPWTMSPPRRPSLAVPDQ
ncbi:ComEC/Rec2 family competence protein [Loktanella sp. DJP18]|uniref:ComEC/Rec2 family competence protein n=1 Tax=Loktanella sp. DJP18 TaxID=3409788 RepID=UPI003BB53FE5